jgi:D-alanine-D-alanine ligase
MQKIAILYGGPSSEHEVSISSAENIISNIDRSLFDPIEVFISKEGILKINAVEYTIIDAVKELKNISDSVYPVLHGTFGEDGKLQKLLEDEGIKFVGSGSVSSQIAIDKNSSNILYSKNNLHVPKSQIITNKDLKIELSFPIIVKPVSEGSSVGLFKCESYEYFLSIKEKIFKLHNEMLIQECILGREFTCGVIEIHNKNVALPISEVILRSGIFDYKTKYTSGECLEVTPAEINTELAERIQKIALMCHRILDCKSISRTDMILSEDNTLYVLETNTLPGMTKTSFIPAQAKAYGLKMKELITILIESAT